MLSPGSSPYEASRLTEILSVRVNKAVGYWLQFLGIQDPYLSIAIFLQTGFNLFDI